MSKPQFAILVSIIAFIKVQAEGWEVDEENGVLTEFLWSRISLERNSEVKRNLVKTQRIQNFSGEKFRSLEKFPEFLWREIL
ncbi:hypothetical protein ACSBR1_034202 [Camellia fascicularis]